MPWRFHEMDPALAGSSDRDRRAPGIERAGADISASAGTRPARRENMRDRAGRS
jgi:hypothetical protein